VERVPYTIKATFSSIRDNAIIDTKVLTLVMNGTSIIGGTAKITQILGSMMGKRFS
jgi:hypothetical protein